MSNYHDMTYINSLPYQYLFDLLDKRAKLDEEDVQWQVYKLNYVNMDNDSFITFEKWLSDYYEAKNMKEIKKEDILSMANDILSRR